jgi:hypothetical protein
MGAHENDTMTNGFTTAGAGAAMVSPWWLPALHEVSQVAAEIVPILGALWLITQIAMKVADYIKRNNGQS